MDSMHRSELTQNADASLLASRSSPYSDLVRSRCVVADEWWTTGHAEPPRWRACALPPALSPCPAAESVCKMNALGDGLVALLLDLLVRPDLLALFAQVGDALLDLLELALRDLLLGLLLLDLVAKGVELVFLGQRRRLGRLLLGLLATSRSCCQRRRTCPPWRATPSWTPPSRPSCDSSILLPKASNLSSLESDAVLDASFSAFLRLLDLVAKGVELVLLGERRRLGRLLLGLLATPRSC